MTPRVATVLSAREWESDLVAAAQDSSSLRLIMRAYQHEDVDERIKELDVVVVGAETSWISTAVLARWRQAGVAVVGIYPRGDRPARTLLESAGVEAVHADDISTKELLRTIKYLPIGRTRSTDTRPIGKLVSVAGPRGGPGRTEIALGLAWSWSRQGHSVLLLDLDLESPALAVRLNVPPRPDLTDAVDAANQRRRLPKDAVRRVDSLDVVVGSHRPGEPPPRAPMLDRLLDAALLTHEIVVADLGPARPDDLDLLKRSDEAVLVSDTSAVGLVRTAQLVADWAGPPPALILNRAKGKRPVGALAAARKWTGLEPTLVIPERPSIRDASARGSRPDRALMRTLSTLKVPT